MKEFMGKVLTKCFGTEEEKNTLAHYLTEKQINLREKVPDIPASFISKVYATSNRSAIVAHLAIYVPCDVCSDAG